MPTNTPPSPPSTPSQVAAPTPEGYGMPPTYSPMDFGRKGKSFLLCEGTPNMAMDERIRAAISNHAIRVLGMRNFKSLHVAHGYSLRANFAFDFTKTPGLYAAMQSALGQRYHVRAESLGVMLISVAEWYTPTDVQKAMYLSPFEILWGRIVKGDHATVVNGLRIGRYGDHSTEETVGLMILDMEERLARPGVKVEVDITFVRTAKHDVDMYQMTIKGTWQGGNRIKPDFMGA